MQNPADKWNQLYSQPDSPWKGGPLQAVRDNIALLMEGKTADLGAGNGRDALFIAAHGGKVSAFDISEEGLKRLAEGAERIGVKNNVHTTVVNLSSFSAKSSYRNVISAFALHFLAYSDGEKLVREMQSMTEPGGLNILADFSDPFPGEEESGSFYPGPDRMRELYKGWKFFSLSEQERKTRQRDENGNQYMKMAFELVIRKPC